MSTKTKEPFGPLGFAALNYAQQGWPVFPVHGIRDGRCTCGNADCEPRQRGKHPRTPHGLKDATTDEQTIRAWWTRWPDANIGHPTGRYVVLDVDGPEGKAALAELEAKHGKLPETLTVRTGRGRHLYFTANGAKVRNSAGKLAPHLDVRGEGGYVILPPSVHQNGKHYKWVEPRSEPAPLSAWIVESLAAPARTETRQGDTPIREGKRNAHLTSLAGSMRRRGMSKDAILAVLLAENEKRCVPKLAQSEVERIAESLSRYSPTEKPTAAGFMLTRLGDLMAEPQERLDWLLDGILPSGGLGLLAAKPKTGKSTLARCLALAIARGEPFLGRATLRGPVIYLALEEKRSEVRAHFRDMGASGDEDIYIHAASAPADALLAITSEVQRYEPALLIIDPVLRFVRIKDGNDYAQVSAALEPVLKLARENRVHVLLVYHLGKGERAETTDAILGSTAFFAAVDTALVMKRYARYRTLQSRQRYGADLAEVTLKFDSGSRIISLGADRSEADTIAVEDQILEFLQGTTEPKTEPEIAEGVEAKTLHVRRGLRDLVRQGKVAREGGGKRGNPYRYRFSFSCSQAIPGTREQKTEKASQARENAERNLVPENRPEPFLVPESDEPEFIRTTDRDDAEVL